MADGIALELGPGIRVAWDDLGRIPSELADGEAPAWRLEGELSPGHSALRVLTGVAGKGTLILLAGVRPEGADGHDAESPRAVLILHTGEVTPLEEALISTQYAANGQAERVGLELYAGDDDYPVRGAGDVTRAGAGDEGGLRREHAWLDFRLDGEAGTAVLEILHA